MENTVDKKVINGKTYKAVDGIKDTCEGCAGFGAGNNQLCADLGMDCLSAEGQDKVWVLEIV